LAGVERDIFFSAYAIRKLMDAGKLSDELESTSLRTSEYRPTVRAVDLMNRDRIDHLYDLSHATRGQVSLRTACNQIIHSFVFSPMLEEDGGLAGFFVASESEKARRLRYISADAWIGVLESVTEDDIVSMTLLRDAVGAPLMIARKSRSLHSHRTE
jgi:hypothetical protein